MKAALSFFALFLISTTALADFPPSIVGDAEVIKAETNSFFPVSKYRLTVMVGCADSIEEAVQRQENGVTKLGVRVRYSTAAACLAMPTEESVDFEVSTFDGPAKVEIINPAPGLTVEFNAF